MTLEELKKNMPGRRVKIVELCNYEKHYAPGDTGTIDHVDDMASLHVNWDKGGSIALLKEDKFDTWLLKEKVLKQVRENFKKKRAVWHLEIASFCELKDAYEFSEEVLGYLESSFTTEEKEKYGFSKLCVATTPGYKYDVEIDYKK